MPTEEEAHRTLPVMSQGKLYGYRIWCPGCLDDHILRGWTFNGDMARPTFSPSLLVTCRTGEGVPDKICHSFIENGQIRYLSDCTHAFKNTTVDLPVIDKP